jgi:heat-inducible transcriptional repressor
VVVDELTGRGKQILEALIEEYITTAEPVGSRTITRRQIVSLSPATVRNVMSDLEELGFLASPHTSAGRIPTDKAYRFYVDSLLEAQRQAVDAADVQQRFTLKSRDLGTALQEASRLLSSLSQYVGVVVAPSMAANMFRQIEFVRLGGRRLLVILVAASGAVQNRLVELEQDIPSEDLIRMANYLNEQLHGLTIAQVKRRLMEEMASDKASYDELLAQAIAVSQQALADEAAQIFIEGQANILEQPEFADIGRMREMFRAFEEKSQLVGLLDRCLQASGVQIFIGAESHLNQMAGMSVITAPYRTGKDTFGVLGVIGPTRMGYAKVIPIVDYTARLISKMLESSD